jgi:flagellar basal-body rod protein FlgF
MLRGIYSAAAGMTSQEIQANAIADNLANVTTPGFKHVTAQFQTFGEVLINRLSSNDQASLGSMAQGSQVMGTAIDFSQGQLTETGNPLDLSLNGEGFFVVKNAQGQELYTRAGNFTRDNSGYLATANGCHVQGNKGDILIPKGASKIQVSGSGDISVDGAVVDRLKIVRFAHNSLERTGSSLYSAHEVPIADSSKTTVQQGFLEQSNANVVTELVNSITGMRAYETMQKSIQMQNETLDKSVNEVGRLV